MSRIIDEFGNTRPEVAERIKPIDSYICNELKDIAKDLELNGEEIRQLYQSEMDTINAEGMEQTMRWGIEKRRRQRGIIEST